MNSTRTRRRWSPFSQANIITTATAFLLFGSAWALAPPPALVNTAIGFAAGSTGAFLCYPIDLVKTLLQTPEGREKYGTDSFACAVGVVKESGPLGLYRGCLVQIAGIAPEKTIKLNVNEFMRGALLSAGGGVTLGAEVLAGGIAGLTQDLVTIPLETVKTKLQTSGREVTFGEVMSDIGGLSGLYQGAAACIARDVIFSACLFPSYAHLRDLTPQLVADPFWSGWLAGALSAAPAAFIATPADTVKTRMQQSRNVSAPNVIGTSGSGGGLKSMTLKAKTGEVELGAIGLAKELGVEVLFSGWSARVVRSAIQFGATLSIFDYLTVLAKGAGLT